MLGEKSNEAGQKGTDENWQFGETSSNLFIEVIAKKIQNHYLNAYDSKTFFRVYAVGLAMYFTTQLHMFGFSIMYDFIFKEQLKDKDEAIDTLKKKLNDR